MSYVELIEETGLSFKEKALKDLNMFYYTMFFFFEICQFFNFTSSKLMKIAVSVKNKYIL